MRVRRNSVELWWRIPWTVTMDGPSAAQAILVYAPPSPISSLPPSVSCPVTNPIIMPIQLSKLCAYFNFSSLFTVALFYFFCVFLSRFMAWKTLEWGCQVRRGAGQVLWLGRRHSLVAFKCDSLIFVFFAVIPRQTIWICMESRRTPCCHVRGGGGGGEGLGLLACLLSKGLRLVKLSVRLVGTINYKNANFNVNRNKYFDQLAKMNFRTHSSLILC